MDKLIKQIKEMHLMGRIWTEIHEDFEELTKIRNSSIYDLLVKFTNKPTNKLLYKVNHIELKNTYEQFNLCCSIDAKVDNGNWSLVIKHCDRYWDPHITSYTSETGLRLDDDIKLLKEKLDKQTEKLTQAINNLTNGKEN